ncbi:MAG: VWA domain-containing protein [Planctomycetes bacterium]|nr:VWA domain-containing protein [Planctomycetota bacterium]
MQSALFLVSFVLFQVAPGHGQPYPHGLPYQPDLDLPVLPESYDPSRQPPPVPPPRDTRDPRDEPPPVFFGEEIPVEADSLIFVLDFSGSMVIADRIHHLKLEFERAVNALPQTFHFNVVAYRCDLQTWSKERQRATPEAKASAIAWVHKLNAADGTATGPAVALALGDKGNVTVVLLTDGAPTCGAMGFEAHRSMIRNANSQGATINVFGIAAFDEYRTFCLNVARDSNGSYWDVPLD